MGLLGGFKAKLIGGPKKTRKIDNSIVVGVRFKTFSEFESDLPSSSEVTQQKKVESSRKNKLTSGFTPGTLNFTSGASKSDTNATLKFTPPSSSFAKSEPENEITSRPQGFETSGTLSFAKSEPSLTSFERENEITSPTFESETFTSGTLSFLKSEPSLTSFERDDGITSPIYESENFIPETLGSTHGAQSVTFSTQNDTDEESNPVFEKVTPKPQPAPRNLKVEVNSPPMPKHKPPPPPSEISDDDGNFTIHFAQNGANNVDNSSDDESYIDQEPDLSPMDYSSVATSIFFGGDEEPTVTRPRNVFFDDDDDEEGMSDASSASA
ncbi:uncharacterized protein LOC103314441 [Tribolium castaneum]|uniref:Uncharacterized protein n=1 Tax=Tribolium castaneum TaxID=7070 RepID=D6X475_TRICA|nr:hypothetical protein TcasGA2_TC011360 [Tribolium castaneum]